jgi:hypothetical protein
VRASAAWSLCFALEGEMIFHKWLSLFSCATVCCCIAQAQTTTATLIGVVRDKSGAAIPQAQVTAQNVATSFTRTAISDGTGSYTISNLPVGEYVIIAEKSGFAKLVQKGITLDVDQNARVDLMLSVGEVADSITVTGDATGVETRSTAVGELVDRTRIQELPLNGRNAMSLARVVPGVISVSAPTVQTQSRSGPSITVAGGRNTQNEFRFDGISYKNLTQNTALNYPSPDALQEFRIQTTNYSAEFGRNSGGVFNSLTRAGTNQFHGSAWEFLRNTDLNARNFFSTTKPDLKQNQYGFTAGGPAIHNRLFFFGSYQGTKIRQSQLLATAHPATTLERQGDFSASPKKPVDPLTNQPFPGGVIPSARFDPVAVKLMDKYLPLANTSDGRWVKLNSQPSNDAQYLWRVDYLISQKNSFDIRFFRDDSDLTFQSGNVAPYAPNRQGIQLDNWAAHDTQTFSPSLLNELRLGVNRLNSFVTVVDSTTLEALGAIYPGVITPQLPNITINGYFNLATTDIFQEHPNIYQIGDTVRWFRGKHSISIGGEWERTEMFNRGSSGNQGTFSFDGSQTGVAFADFLIGKPVKLTQNSPYERLVKGWDWYAFAQDEIRVSQRVTVNLGLRYQWFQPYHAVYDRTNTYRAGQKSIVKPDAPPGMVFPGDPGVPSGLVPTDKNNFGPRAGFAWDVRGDGRLSIRAGYGLYFEDMRSDVWTYPAVNQPFVISNTVNTPYSFADPYHGLIDPFPYVYSPSTAKFSFPMGLFTVPGPTLSSPYTHELNFTIEKALPAAMVLKASYVGKLEHNLLQMLQKNPAAYILGQSTLANTDQRRILLPGIYTSFREIDTNSNAAYHSLELSLTRRFSSGLTFLAAYTFGKLLDYYSAQNLGQTPQDPYNERADRARSDEDRNHVFSASFVYELPFFRHANRVLSTTVGGWSVSGLITAASGLPVYVISGRDFSLTGVGFDRPDLIGNVTLSHPSKADMLARYFNTAAFVANQPGHYGSAGRNLFSGPGLFNTDLSLVKRFPISEKFGALQFRSEFFNALNRANFGQPDGNLINQTFGRIQTAADPRVLQFALRYQF